ncbi:hypothetical protein Fcan01_00151 [Folsomia candida]|uniref:CCHC-type domain-containing protein n=1 Tax=Folsomia candida TaxID=158441 RepID=A0A226EZ55_FOLCA|nr:hypothetical protein Fcan01_00151 [Folsomia candida]
MNTNKPTIEQQNKERDQRYLNRQETLAQGCKYIRGKRRNPRKSNSSVDWDTMIGDQSTAEGNDQTTSQGNARSRSQGSPQSKASGSRASSQSENLNLDGLSAEQRSRVEKFIAQELTQNKHVIQIRHVNTSIDIPQFDPKRMCTSTYFTNLEKYFAAQGYQYHDYHNYLGGVLKGEFKYWYDAHSHEIGSFRDFKHAFKKKYDDGIMARERMKQFFSRRQKLHDPCEQFVYEMVALGKQIIGNSNDDIKGILGNIRDLLYPEIGILIQDDSLADIDDFLNRVGTIHGNLLRQAQQKNKRIEIPPMRGSREELLKQKQNNQSNQFNQSNQSNRNSNYRGRENYKSSYYGSREYKNGYYNSNNNSNSNCNGNNGNSSNSKNSHNSHNQGKSETQSSSQSRGQSRGNSSRGRGTQSRGTRGHPDLTNVRCRRCQRFGHYARDCTATDVALNMVPIQNSNPFNFPNHPNPSPFMPQNSFGQLHYNSNVKYPQHGNGNNNSNFNPNSFNSVPSSSNFNNANDNLNYQGRTYESSTRGFSQH